LFFQKWKAFTKIQDNYIETQLSWTLLDLCKGCP